MAMVVSVKADSAAAAPAGPWWKAEAPVLVVAIILLLTTALKFAAYAGQPLGVDEVWTGMIAGQTSVAALIRQCELEVNGPLSYVVAWLWAQWGGLSNASLRLPSTLFACATPLVALAPRRLMPPTVRMVWAVLLACWLPEFAFAQLARCYALVVLLATANTVAFARLLNRPSPGAAILWSVLGALLILDHYFAAILIACQGFAFLALRRGKAIRTWPAAVIFIPALAEPAFKANILSQFAKPGVSWIDRLTLADLPSLARFLTGSLALAGAMAMALGVGWLIHIRRSRQRDFPPRMGGDVGLIVAALMALLATTISIGLGFLAPILTPRYLTAEVPGLMLAVALMAGRFARAWPPLPALVVASAVGGVIWLASQMEFVNEPAVTAFSFERAAKALIADNPKGLVFFWDNPIAQGGDHQQLSEVGEFFFKRAGHAIPVDAVSSVGAADPNVVLMSKAQAPGTDILWMFDRDVDGTAAVAYPPDISRRDPRWTCRDFGGGADIGILACRRRSPA
jgi:hypothetical protein